LKPIHEIVEEVENNIVGRLANKVGNERIDNTETLLKYVLKAGGGNHLEIGTLFGGSAIAVALLKNYYGQSGIVICIDPLNGYYVKYSGHGDDMSGFPVSPEALFENIEKFGVGNRIAVIGADSQEVKLSGIEFTTAYIDGDHQDDVPFKDWNMCKDTVSRYIVFDNCDEKHPDVQFACGKAADEYGWGLVFKDNISFVVEKTI